MKKKKLITIETILKDFNVKSRLLISLLFIICSIFLILASFIVYSNSNTKSFLNLILTILFNFCMFMIFGYFIGLNRFIEAIYLYKKIKQKDFTIEVDEVIDKITLSNKYQVVLKYNKANMYINEWEKIKVGQTFYVFNFKNECSIKNTDDYLLSDELKALLIDGHLNNNENKIEIWE